MFRLHAKYQATGDQPAAIGALVKSLHEGKRDQVLLGVTGSGKTFTIANVIEKVQRPTLIIAPNKTLAAQLYQEYKAFFRDNAVEYFVSYYDYYQPEAYIKTTDTYIEKDSAVNEEIDKLRNAATAALIMRKDVIIVASVSAIYGLGSPEIYKKMTIAIDLKTGISRKKLMERLISLRYERNDISFTRGSFRIKGDVIDVYPSYLEIGYRLEFWGEDLENISEIHTVTGEKIKKNVERIVIYAATQYITEEEDLDRIVKEIKEDQEKEVRAFQEQGKLLEAQRLQQRVDYDIEMIKEIGYCKGIENYARYLAKKDPGETPNTLLEYFPEDFLLVLDESHVGVPQIRGMYNGDIARKTSLVENGFRLKAALDNRPLQFEEFRKHTGQTIYVSATPGDYELSKAGKAVVEQLIRPTGILDPFIEVRKTKGQVDDLLEEIRIRARKQQRILVTTLTKKMAEELTEYYTELGVKVRYMHSDVDTLERIEIIKSLRKGEIDVLIGINLLREGLDIPEVSLVAILEADKEGFLRSRRSLIQTIGRAARNIEGRVILYGDSITDSMAIAIDETQRRRKIQENYNVLHGIQPESIVKEIGEEMIQLDYGISKDAFEKKSKKKYKNREEIEKEIAKCNKKIVKLSKELDFEQAILVRDEMKKLREMLLSF